ncbi:MAG: hypothetical protein SOS24_10350 [Clostridia bacterium]|nr:hypothetical protein [Clostridia bacterium]
MKLNKKVACLALTAALSAASVSAFAATPDYDYLMVKAEEAYQQGMYYESSALLEKANSVIYNTPQYKALKAAVDFRIMVLNSLPAVKALPQAFSLIDSLMAEGLYYESADLLGNVKSVFANEIAASAEFTSKIGMYEIRINEKIAEWEFRDAMNKAYSYYYDKLYYQAQDALANVPVSTQAQRNEFTKLADKVAYKIAHIAADPNEAIAILKRDMNIAKDPDFGFEASAVYVGGELTGYTITVYSKKAYNLGYASTLSTYFVDVAGGCTRLS